MCGKTVLLFIKCTKRIQYSKHYFDIVGVKNDKRHEKGP